MKSALIPDVGDGLSFTLGTSKKTYQIDCGSQHKPKCAFKKMDRGRYFFESEPEVFILSHFHKDHYNGLLEPSRESSTYKRFNFNKVYHPRMPIFDRDEELAYALFTINKRVLGDKSGVPQRDFLQVISKLNRNQDFEYKSLSKGDKIEDEFEVLWPPFRLEDGNIKKSVRSALRDFQTALEEDDITKKIYESLKKENIFERLRRRENSGEAPAVDTAETYKQIEFKSIERELPSAVEDANESLRDVANRLSLAFEKQDDILFLGDLESYEIEKSLRDLMNQHDNLSYSLLLPAHHGTHWHDILDNINVDYVVASCGKRLHKYLELKYKDISELYFATQINGDVLLRIVVTGKLSIGSIVE